jgi:hypothetical protein
MWKNEKSNKVSKNLNFLSYGVILEKLQIVCEHKNIFLEKV